MKSLSGKSEKWAAGILAVVSLGLLANLIFHSGLTARAGNPTTPKVRSTGVRAPVPRTSAQDVALAGDPEVDLTLLENLQNRPLPELARNPFEFPPPPAPHRSAGGVAQPQAPPPPPPLPLHAIGYSQQAGQPPQAVVVGEEEIFVVHAGETFGKRFQVLSLTPTRVEIHDAVTQQTVQLPIGP